MLLVMMVMEVNLSNMHMKHAYNFDEALKMAYEIKGNDAKVVVIPDGVSVIVK